MMKFNNQQIYQIANNVVKTLGNLNIYIPAKANFFLQKNKYAEHTKFYEHFKR